MYIYVIHTEFVEIVRLRVLSLEFYWKKTSLVV